LSICIPTFNRAQCLAELLDSIVEQGTPDVEVVVSDDASSDNTAEVIANYKSRLPRVKFLQQPWNIGLDRNFLAAVDNASGDYVWLMGDDDKLLPGAVEKVLTALAGWPDIVGMTVGVIDYDREFQAATGMRKMPPTARISGAEAVFSSVAELLGFMSTLVFNRSMWGVVCREDPVLDYENYYIQVYIIGRMMQRFGDWGILNDACVGYRSNNDQLQTKFGWLERLKIDVIAYEQIANGLFAGLPSVRRTMTRRIFSTHVLSRIRIAKTRSEPTQGFWTATRFLCGHYKSVPAFWYSALPTLLLPKWLMRIVRVAYQRYSSSSGTQRVKRALRGS
jgi:glycosyltransferase involved in cell wall biosynthesis